MRRLTDLLRSLTVAVPLGASEPRASASGARPEFSYRRLRRLFPGGTAGLAGCLFAASLLAQDQTAQITGTVVDALTHQPVKHATVTLTYISAQNGKDGRTVSTDAAGAFSFDALAEGTYQFGAMHPSYPRGSNPRPVEVKAGGKTSVDVELTPGAIISGSIFDESGDPLPGCFVQAAYFSRPDRQQWQANANPDGEYRIHGLAPGKYVVSARCTGGPFVPRPFSAGPDPPASLAYRAQFYPAANDAKSAQAVELAPGAEKPGIDFRMRPVPATQVRGTVASPSGDFRFDGGLSMMLWPVAGPQFESQGSPVDPQKGTFQFYRVFPGSYYVFAMSDGDPATRMNAFERIEVKDRPVELAMTLAHGVDLAGSVTIEDNNTADITQVQVRLQPDVPAGPGVGQVQVKDDGTFVIKAVPANRWRVMVYAPRLYVKSVWLGNTDVTGSAFEVAAGSEGLRIVMSGNMGTISGTAPVGAMVYAASEGNYQRLPTVQVDQTGRFTLSEVPPGKYRVGLMDRGNPIPDEGGQEITVKEGETVTVDVKQN